MAIFAITVNEPTKIYFHLKGFQRMIGNETSRKRPKISSLGGHLREVRACESLDHNWHHQNMVTAETNDNFKLIALKVVAVAYERWSLIRGYKYDDLTGKLLVFWKTCR